MQRLYLELPVGLLGAALLSRLASTVSIAVRAADTEPVGRALLAADPATRGLLSNLPSDDNCLYTAVIRLYIQGRTTNTQQQQQRGQNMRDRVSGVF